MRDTDGKACFGESIKAERNLPQDWGLGGNLPQDRGLRGRPSLVIELIPCTCGGKGQQPWDHTPTCPRGRALRRRIK